MQKYIWSDKFSVGVVEIDKQHQHFFEIVNDIIEVSAQQDVTVRDLLFKITNLTNYAVYHLLTEENLFSRYNYSDAKDHINAHNAYREKMKHLIADVEKESVDTKKMSLEMAEFAGEWLVNHIVGMDQKYVGFMKEQGIS